MDPPPKKKKKAVILEVPRMRRLPCLLKGSWDLVTRVIIMVTILITTYNPN